MRTIGGVQMEGNMFYWICWMYWVYLTFLLDKKNPYRLKLSAVILVIIIFSKIHFSVFSFDIYFSGLSLLLISYMLIGKEKKALIFYYFICSFIITISYVTFHLFEIFDPIWVIFKDNWMIAICVSILALMLQKNLRGRILIAVSGTMQGEILYAYILSKYPFPYSIGSFAYLDVCLLISAILTGWSFLENAGTYFGNHIGAFSNANKNHHK
jgi:hypothetical protein